METPHFIIIAKGTSSLYRTILSVWMQDIRPASVNFIAEAGNFEKIRTSINTVVEDSAVDNIPFHLHEQNSIALNKVIRGLSPNTVFFLVERDFLLPEASKTGLEALRKDSEYIIAKQTFWQRTNSGNSEAVTINQLKKLRELPLSTLILNSSKYLENDLELNWNSNFEVVNLHDSISSAYISGNHCVVNSNRKAPYLPKFHN